MQSTSQTHNTKCGFYCSSIYICSVLVQRGAPNSPAQVNLACANEATSVINLLGIIIQAFWASALRSPELWVIVLAGWDQQEPLFNWRQLCEGPHTLICLLFRPCLSALGSQHPLSDSCIFCTPRVLRGPRLSDKPHNALSSRAGLLLQLGPSLISE